MSDVCYQHYINGSLEPAEDDTADFYFHLTGVKTVADTPKKRRLYLAASL